MPLTDDEVFAQPVRAAAPRGAGMTDEEVFGGGKTAKAPAASPMDEKPGGFTEEFKKAFKGGSLEGVWGLLKESMPRNLWVAATGKDAIASRKQIEAAALLRANQIVRDQQSWPADAVRKAYELLGADAKKKKLEEEQGLLGGAQEMVAGALENPGQATAELANSLIRDPWQVAPVAGQIGRGATWGGRVAGVAGAGAATNAAIEAAAGGAKGEADPMKIGQAAVAGGVIGAPFALVGKSPATLRAASKERARGAMEAVKNDTILDMAEQYADARPPAEPPEFIPPKDFSKMKPKERAAYEKKRNEAMERFAADQEAAANYDPEAMQAEIEASLMRYFDESQAAIPEEPKAEPPVYNAPSAPDVDLPAGHLAGLVPKGKLVEPPIVGAEPPVPTPADPHITLFESARDKVVAGKAWDLTAAEKVALRGHVDSVTRGGVIDPQTSRARQRGQVDPRLLGLMAAGALGAAALGTDWDNEDAKKYIAAGIAGSMGLVGKGRPFYHAVPEVLGKIGRKAGTAAEWAAEIKAGAGKLGKGAAEEWEAMGGPEWLAAKEGKVTKAEIADFIEKNGVRMEERVLGHTQADQQAVEEAQSTFSRYGYEAVENPDDPGNYAARHLMSGEIVDFMDVGEHAQDLDAGRAAELLDRYYHGGQDMGEMTAHEDYEGIPKYDSPNLRLPGEFTNYREHLVKLPERGSTEQAVTERDLAQKALEDWRDAHPGLSATERMQNPEYSALYDHWISFGDEPAPRSSNNFTQSHHSDANIVTHGRTTDRVAADGTKGMQIEEIQSDWEQLQRLWNQKDKLHEELDKLQEKKERLLADQNDAMAAGLELPAGTTRADYNALRKAIQEKETQIHSVEADIRGRDRPPPSLFRGATEAWTSLMFRRLLAKAVEEGKDWVAWTTGKQQNDRYNLRTHVDELMYDPDTQTLRGHKNGSEAFTYDNIAPDRLAEYVGNGVAEKLLAPARAADREAVDAAQKSYERSRAAYLRARSEEQLLHEAWRRRTNGVDVDLFNRLDNARVETTSALRRMNSAESQRDLARLNNLHRVSGPDLEVGQKDLRPFYDKILRGVAEKVSKKLGGEGVVEIPLEGARNFKRGDLTVMQDSNFETHSVYDRQLRQVEGPFHSIDAADEAMAQLYKNGVGMTQPGIRITPALRANVAKGMPLFGRQGGFIDPKLSAALGLGAAGGVAGLAVSAWLGAKDKKEWGAAMGGLLGVAAALGALKKPGAAINWGLGLVSREFNQLDPRLRRVMTHFEREALETNLRDHVKVAPFVETFRKMPAAAKQDVALALAKGTAEARAAIAAKYPNLRAALDAVDVLVKEKSDWLRSERRFKGGPEYYWHQQVKDLNGLLEALGKDEANGLSAELIKLENRVKAQAGRLPTEMERAEVVADWMKRTKAGLSHRAGYTKKRTVEMTPELLQFYHDPGTALLAFLAEANKDIARTKLFGKNAVNKSQDGVKYLNIEASIGKVVERQMLEGRLTNQQAAKLRDLLRSRLGPGEQSMPGWHQDIQNVVSASLLGHLTNAIKQVPDYAMGMVLVGVRPMLQATLDGLRGRSKITLHDMGLINNVMDEFTQSRLSSRYLTWVLNHSGFSHIDTAARHTLINAALAKYTRDAVKGGKLLERDYAKEFSPNELAQLKDDLLRGEKTTLVRDLVFMELSDAQPISRLERPQAYLDHPSGRFMYHLKSYTLKQLDIARREVLDNFKNGRKAEALKKAAGLAIVWGAAGAGTETLVDYLLGQKSKFEDKVFDNIARNLGWNDWAGRQLVGEPGRSGNAAAAAGMLVAPPAAGVIYDIAAGKQQAIRHIPLIGRFLYSYGMGGALEQRERELIKEGGLPQVKEDRALREETGQATARDKERLRMQKQKLDDQEQRARKSGQEDKADKLLKRSEDLRGRLEKMQYRGPDSHFDAYRKSTPRPRGIDGPAPFDQAPQTLDQGWRPPAGVRVPPPTRPLPEVDRARARRIVA